MNQNQLTIYPHPDFLGKAERFIEKYDLVDFIFVGDERYSKRNLKGYSSRTCRFCKKSYPKVSFSSLSHLVPQLIGNSNMYSDFECDECNKFFSTLENDLAAYLSLSRSISGLQAEKSAPGFTARRIKAKSRSFVGDNILIIAPEDLKPNGDGMSFTYTKNAYSPLKVYKALLKSALSLLDETEIKREYRHAIDCLLGKVIIGQGAFVTGYRLSFALNMPLHAFCFKKKYQKDKIPEHAICFNFQSSIIVLPLPCDSCAGNINVIIPPPYFIHEKMLINASPAPFIRDFCSNKEVADDEEVITVQTNPEDLGNLHCYDPVTDTQQPGRYDPAQVKHLILTKEGVSVDPKEFSAFIKKEMGE